MSFLQQHGLQLLHDQPPVFESSDPQAVATHTTHMLQEHQLKWRQGQVQTAIRSTQVGELTFLLLRYGAAVHIAPGKLNDFYLFQVPLNAQAHVRVGTQSVALSSNTAALISPHQDLQLDWEEGCEQFLIKIPKHCMDAACLALTDIAPEETIYFEPAYAMGGVHAQAWQHQISALLSYADQSSAMPQQWVKNQQSNLLQHLLCTQANSYSHYLKQPARLTGQRRLRLARRYIHENLSQPLSLECIAAASNSSVRSLTKAFKEQLHTSPMIYIRRARLDAVRHDLLQAAPTANVTHIASSHGFNHLGRFSQWYKAVFNESPLETLQK